MLKLCLFEKLQSVVKSSSQIPHPWPLPWSAIYRLLKQQPVLQSDFLSPAAAQVGFSTWLCKRHRWSNWICLFQCFTFRPGVHTENTHLSKVRLFATISIKHLACFEKKKVQWYHKNMWKFMSVFDFLLCHLAQHVFFFCLTGWCSAGKVGQMLCSDFQPFVNNKSWHYSWSNCFHCGNTSLSFPQQGETVLEVQLCTWTSKKSL